MKGGANNYSVRPLTASMWCMVDSLRWGVVINIWVLSPMIIKRAPGTIVWHLTFFVDSWWQLYVNTLGLEHSVELCWIPFAPITTVVYWPVFLSSACVLGCGSLDMWFVNFSLRPLEQRSGGNWCHIWLNYDNCTSNGNYRVLLKSHPFKQLDLTLSVHFLYPYFMLIDILTKFAVAAGCRLILLWC